jgi:hypothetical protein
MADLAHTPRRRNTAALTSLTIERVEHLIIEVRNVAAVSQLLDGLSRRVVNLEDGMMAAYRNPPPSSGNGSDAGIHRPVNGK